MTKQQKNIAAYMELTTSPFCNIEHINAPSVEVVRIRRLMGLLIDSAKIENSESVLMADFMDMCLSKELVHATSNFLQLRFNGVKEAFVPASSVCKEYLSPVIFRHPVQFRIDRIKRDDAYWAKAISHLSTRSVIRYPKHERGEYAILHSRNGINIDGNIYIR